MAFLSTITQLAFSLGQDLAGKLPEKITPFQKAPERSGNVYPNFSIPL